MNLVKNLVDKTAEYFGFNESSIGKTSYHKQEMLDNLTGRSASLSDYLYHRYYDEEEQLFFLEGDVAGFILEIQPIVGVDDALLKNLDYLFNTELPYGSYLQFFLIASNEVSGILDEYAKSRTNHNPILQKLTSRYTTFVSKMACSFGDYDGRLARNFRIYVSYSKFCKSGKKVLPIEVAGIQSFKKLFVKKLEALKLSPRICNDLDLIGLSKEIFEFQPKPFIGLNKNANNASNHATLDRRMLSSGMQFRLDEDGFHNETNNSITRCYTPSELPEGFSLAKMINLLGTSDGGGIPARFAISYTVATNIGEAAQGGMQARGKKVIHAAEQWYSRNNRNLQRDAAEWRDIIDQAKNKERFLTDSFQVILTCPANKIEESEQGLLSLYRGSDWGIEVNNKFHLPLLLSCLPLHQPHYHKNLIMYKKAEICMGMRATAKLPIHAEWKGVPKPGVLFFGRRGQLFHWNPFYRISSGNYNVCVFGPSGGGKSVFLQALSASMMAMGTKVFILDIGQSFAELSKLLGGEIIQFGKDVKLALNPFAGFAADMEEDDFKDLVKCAKELLKIMCGAKDERGEAELEKAIIESLKENNHQMDINGFTEYLSRQSSLMKEYGITLYSYTKSGVYGKYFTGANSASFKEQITIFEFEEIKKDTKLLAIILQILLMEVTNQFFTGDRSKPFMIIVDEAWMLLDYAAGFFAAFARTVRKYGGSLVTCVQNFNDLQKTDQHRAILENSTWTMLLKQDEKGLEAFKESEAFKDMLPLIRSISLAPGKYSEMLISATGVNVVGRLVLDEYSNTLYSTDAGDFNYLNKAQQQGINLDAAIEELAERKYGNQ